MGFCIGDLRYQDRRSEVQPYESCFDLHQDQRYCRMIGDSLEVIWLGGEELRLWCHSTWVWILTCHLLVLYFLFFIFWFGFLLCKIENIIVLPHKVGRLQWINICKVLKQCLADSKHTINVNSYYLLPFQILHDICKRWCIWRTLESFSNIPLSYLKMMARNACTVKNYKNFSCIR